MRSLLVFTTAVLAAARAPHARTGKANHRGGFKRPHRVEPKGTLNDVSGYRCVLQSNHYLKTR